MGTHEIIEILKSIDTNVRSARQTDLFGTHRGTQEDQQLSLGDEVSLSSVAIAKLKEMYDRILDPQVDDDTLGFRRDQMPCLINLNGDLLWVPADLLRFLWHTRASDPQAAIPHFVPESQPYTWIRERLKPGDIALDCGANIGLYSVMMATRAGTTGSVHAFEPSPKACSDLSRVLRLNRIHWVVVNNCALSDSGGEAVFREISGRAVQLGGAHSAALRNPSTPSVSNKNDMEVPTTTLDAYVEQKRIIPRLIRIDVKRRELAVLEGGRKCIEWFKPRLLIDVHPDEHGVFDHERLRHYLESYGYTHSFEGKSYYCT